ncbi:MAG: hypothetical protein IPH28_12030 [Cytophagaceae bacterium]|nr:hypothetical protein [Cytophagaceae bacterium]MBK9932680.1 hypothetical protein [Cytophagaceae bacterium]MBL0303629.1 hypothetical protein [Cytophagaceae bacterium]MBL0326458.1 hypothetical protein [Cytophagaceae bacterium]
MTSATLKKLRTITYDSAGKPASVTLNLKNKNFRKFYEVLMEDYLDVLAIKKELKEDDGARFSLKKEGNSFIFEEINQ